MVLGLLGVAGLLVLSYPAWAEVPDTVAIAQVLSDPASFNLEVVTVTGTIRDIRAITVDAECGTGTGYVLYLSDETGELTIRDEGTCSEEGLAPAVAGHFRRGERVLVRAALVEPPGGTPDTSPVEATLVRIDRLND